MQNYIAFFTFITRNYLDIVVHNFKAMNTRILRWMIAIILFASPIFSMAQKKAITHEEMTAMKRVGAPKVSPDGKWILFSVSDVSYDDKENNSDLWIASSDGSKKPRKLTNSKGSEGGYAWSPDSKTIAFSAKREGDEVSQIYLLNFAEGGEAQRFSNLSTGASSPQWSPDGKSILFTSRVYVGAFSDSTNKKIADEKKKVKYKARIYTTFPIRSWDTWVDEKQTHPFIQSTETGSVAKDLFVEVKMSLEQGFGFSGDMCWSNDSKEIIFSATTERTAAAYKDVVSNLYRLSIKGGDAVQLTNDGYDYGSPEFSGDGKYLLCVSSAANNYKVYNQNKITRFDYPSISNKKILAESLDRVINNLMIVGNTIYMSIEDAGKDRLVKVNIANGNIESITSAQKGCYTNISVSEGKSPIIVCNYDAANMPAEVVRVNGTKHSNISTFNNERLEKLDLPEVEEVWFTSSRGKKIRSLLVRPAGFDASKKYPLFVVMHGGPAGSWKDNWGYRWNYHLLAAPGYVLLLTDYTGSTGYGEKFSQDIQFDPFKGPADEINEAAADAIQKFSFIDGNLQAAGGASYGGHLANWMQASTTHYKCLINHAGLMNSESQWGTSDGIYGREVMNGGAPWTQTKSWKEQNPIRYAEKFKTPMLVTIGEQDFRVPLNNAIETWNTLQRLKIPSKLLVFPEENHWILKPENSRFFYKEVHHWLKEYLK